MTTPVQPIVDEPVAQENWCCAIVADDTMTLERKVELLHAAAEDYLKRLEEQGR
jgi:hypothetical protein